jgi:hypothetical protein
MPAEPVAEIKYLAVLQRDGSSYIIDLYPYECDEYVAGARRHGNKSKIHQGAPEAVAFKWFYEKVIREGKKPQDIDLGTRAAAASAAASGEHRQGHRSRVLV